jgi:hypothetical protein
MAYVIVIEDEDDGNGQVEGQNGDKAIEEDRKEFQSSNSSKYFYYYYNILLLCALKSNLAHFVHYIVNSAGDWMDRTSTFHRTLKKRT